MCVSVTVGTENNANSQQKVQIRKQRKYAHMGVCVCVCACKRVAPPRTRQKTRKVSCRRLRKLECGLQMVFMRPGREWGVDKMDSFYDTLEGYFNSFGDDVSVMVLGDLKARVRDIVIYGMAARSGAPWVNDSWERLTEMYVD